MARSKTGTPVLDYLSKKGAEEVPVAPCQGWTDDCEFCDKRFGKWEEADEDVLARVPAKPGIFAVALKSKNATEVVDIALDKTDLQKTAFARIDRAKASISDKKSKATKSVVLCRWMTFKQTKDKDVVNLCAHWINNGVMPKLQEQWVGEDILRDTDLLTYSDKLRRWCYAQKDAYWKKPKLPPTKIAEVVEGCVWNEPCELCDSYFGDWRSIDEVVHGCLAPHSPGVYMVGVKYGKTVETINIVFDQKQLTVTIDDSMKHTHSNLAFLLKSKKYLDRNTTFVVRWLAISDAGTDNCCYLYAHWLNADKMPEMNYGLPGEKQLDRNKNFVMRNHDKKWCDEIMMFQNLKKSKFKNKKHIMQDLEDDYRNLNCAADET